MFKKIDETHISNNRTIEIYTFLHEGKTYPIYIFDDQGLYYDMVLSLENAITYITSTNNLIRNKDRFDIKEYFAGEEPNWDAFKVKIISIINNQNA